MGNAKPGAGKNRKPDTGKKNTTAKPPRKTKAEIVDEAIHAFEKKLQDNQVKATVGDFVRLLQLQKEIAGNEPKDVEVTWVEPGETESSEK